MVDDIGILRASIEMAPLDRPERRQTLAGVMVDTGSEYSWAPEEVLAELGVVPVRVDRFETASGEIGAQSLDGLNLRIDLARRDLVPGGPLPAAAAA